MLSDEGDVVFLLDVDNTLLDNDRFGADLGARLEQAFGADQRDRYWAIFAALREELSYADYLAALQKFRVGLDDNPGFAADVLIHARVSVREIACIRARSKRSRTSVRWGCRWFCPTATSYSSRARSSARASGMRCRGGC